MRKRRYYCFRMGMGFFPAVVVFSLDIASLGYVSLLGGVGHAQAPDTPSSGQLPPPPIARDIAKTIPDGSEIAIDVLAENDRRQDGAGRADVALSSATCGQAKVADGRITFQATPVGACPQGQAVISYILELPDEANPQDRKIAGTITLTLASPAPPSEPLVPSPDPTPVDPPPEQPQQVITPPPVEPPSPPVEPPPTATAITPTSVESCNLKGPSFKVVRIAGGRIDKPDAPPGLEDILDLIPTDTFEVQPFCIMLAPVPSDEMARFLASLPDDKRRDMTGEPPLGASPETSPETSPESAPPEVERKKSRIPSVAFECSLLDTVPAVRVNRALAEAYVTYATETYAPSGLRFSLPSLEEYVAAAIAFEKFHQGTPEAGTFLIGLRRCIQEWTANSCGEGRFHTVGQNQRQDLERLCYVGADRRGNVGLRLVLR